MNEQIINMDDETLVQQKRSTMATASLICSLILCCPIVTFIGVILGIVALRKMRGTEMTGRGLALAGIVTGIVTTLLSSAAITFAVLAGLSVLKQTPQAVTSAIESGIAGDLTAFREEFTLGALSASDEEINTFIGTLTSRYGTFDEAVVDMAAVQEDNSPSGAESQLPIQLVFETNTVAATVVIVVVPSSDSMMNVQIQCITIHDPIAGDIAFPKASHCGSNIQETPTPESCHVHDATISRFSN